MRRWIGFACAAAALCAVAWYFGRPNKAPVASPTTVSAVTPAPTESRPTPPPKVLDVIDLARAYEPVPEPEQVLPGGIDPASFIEEPSAPSRIPPAVELEEMIEDLLAVLQSTNSCFGCDLAMPERAQALVWELLSPSGVGPWVFYSTYPSDCAYMPGKPQSRRGLRVAVRGLGTSINISPLWVMDNELWPEVIDVMPREVNPDLPRILDLYGYRGVCRGSTGRPLLIEPGSESGVQQDAITRESALPIGQMQAWQESLAAWLIASWSGPLTCPKAIRVAPLENDR